MTDLVQLVPQDRLEARVAEIAARISEDYAGGELDLVYALNGAAAFCAGLVRTLAIPARMHPFGFSNYGGATPTGEVRITLDVAAPLHGRKVLFVEGVVVSGRTPKYIVDMLRLRQPASLAVCALGVKTRLMTADLRVDYAAFEFGDEMVVGYGVGEGSEKTLPFLADSRGRSGTR